MAENKKPKVIFRRINGRTIPIFSGKGSVGGSNQERAKNVGKGAALVATGAAASVYAGQAAGKTVITAAKFENAARDLGKRARSIMDEAAMRARHFASKGGPQMTFDFKSGPAYMFRHGQEARLKSVGDAALRSSISSIKAFQLRKPIKAAGLFVGGGLIGAGLKKLYESVTGEKSDTVSDVITGAAGGVAAVGIAAAYRKTLSGGSFAEAIQKSLHIMKKFK